MTRGKRCPVCKSDVPAEARDCPNCPHTFIREEYQKPKARFGPAAWHPAIWVGLVFVALVGIWRALEFVIIEGDPYNKNSVTQSFVDKQRIVVKTAQGEMKVISAGQPEVDSKARQVAGAKPQLPSILQEAVAGEAEEVAVAHSARTHAAPKEWRLRGVVYDLVTLEPIPHCSMFFTDPETQSRFETSTDDMGAYRTIVPPLRNKAYRVTFEKEGYARSYLNPGTEGVPQISAVDRRALASDLAKSIDEPYDVQVYGSDPLKTDFYLAPLAARGYKRAD